MTTLSADHFFQRLLDDSLGTDGDAIEVGDQQFVMHDGIPRSKKLHSQAQDQTRKSFGFQWHMREIFLSPAYRKSMRDWLLERYGDIAQVRWWLEYGDRPIVLDAGCGAALSAIEMFSTMFDKIRYVGADVSDSVEVARDRFKENGYPSRFIQCDLGSLPFPPESVDVILSEGVLHHTDSTESSLKSLAKLIAPGGRFLFYVYRRKGPVREFTDDYIRERLQPLSPEEAFDKLMPLTKLGKTLGELDIEIEIEEPIELLQIPVGKINLQRLIYWHVAKMFYRPDFTLEEMNHYNYDWYAPKNASRHTEEELRRWCAEAGLEVEHEFIEEPGITMIARKVSAN